MPRSFRLVLFAAVLAASVHVPAAGAATRTIVGECDLVLSVTRSGSSLSVSTPTPGPCLVWSDRGFAGRVDGTAQLAGTLPGVVGFTCTHGVGDGDADLWLTIGGTPASFGDLDFKAAVVENVMVVTVSRTDVQASVVGTGVFLEDAARSELCGGPLPTKSVWTGRLVFEDPQVD